MIESKSKGYCHFNDSNSDTLTRKTDINYQLFNLDIEPILDNSSHYFCTKCLKFPYIKFCKDRKNIRITCSCLSNKKVLIDDLFSSDSKYKFLFKKNNLFTKNNSDENYYEDIIINYFICKKHKKKFKLFSTNLMNNFCLDCIEAQTEKDNIIHFHDIKIENEKILQLLEKINKHNDYSNDKDKDTKFIINDNSFEKLPEYEENGFGKLINIIINDYKMYPNFSHFFNIKNLLHFFNIEDYIVIEKEKKKN